MGYISTGLTPDGVTINTNASGQLQTIFGAYYPIASNNTGTFSSIPAYSSYLLVVYDAGNDPLIQLNGDTGSNYDFTYNLYSVGNPHTINSNGTSFDLGVGGASSVDMRFVYLKPDAANSAIQMSGTVGGAQVLGQFSGSYTGASQVLSSMTVSKGSKFILLGTNQY